MATQTIEHTQQHQRDVVDINDKAIVITGGTTGIGRATARLLVEQGARVFIFGRQQNDLDDAMGHIHQSGRGQVHGITADQANFDDVQRVFREADQKLGGVDILINNAAVSVGDILGDFSQVQYAINANLIGYMACTREAILRMRKKPQSEEARGHVVMVGSMSADVLEPGSKIYATTKAAIEAFSISLRKSINKENIRISLIEPGAVATDLGGSSANEKREKQKDPLGILEPDDIARAIHYVITQPARVDVVTVEIRPTKQLI